MEPFKIVLGTLGRSGCVHYQLCTTKYVEDGHCGQYSSTVSTFILVRSPQWMFSLQEISVYLSHLHIGIGTNRPIEHYQNILYILWPPRQRLLLQQWQNESKNSKGSKSKLTINLTVHICQIILHLKSSHSSKWNGSMQKQKFYCFVYFSPDIYYNPR